MVDHGRSWSTTVTPPTWDRWDRMAQPLRCWSDIFFARISFSCGQSMKSLWLSFFFKLDSAHSVLRPYLCVSVHRSRRWRPPRWCMALEVLLAAVLFLRSAGVAGRSPNSHRAPLKENSFPEPCLHLRGSCLSSIELTLDSASSFGSPSTLLYKE